MDTLPAKEQGTQISAQLRPPTTDLGVRGRRREASHTPGVAPRPPHHGGAREAGPQLRTQRRVRRAGGCPTSRGGGAPGERVGRRGARATTRRGDGVDASERSSAAQVADAQNWEQRVKSELEASKQWYKDWGSLYAPSQPTNYQDRIEKLQAKADEIPGVRLQTNNSIYGTGKPFKEFVTVKEKKPDLF